MTKNYNILVIYFKIFLVNMNTSIPNLQGQTDIPFLGTFKLVKKLIDCLNSSLNYLKKQLRPCLHPPPKKKRKKTDLLPQGYYNILTLTVSFFPLNFIFNLKKSRFFFFKLHVYYMIIILYDHSPCSKIL